MLVENPRAPQPQNHTTVTFTPALPVATATTDNVPPPPPTEETPATTVENPDIELAGAGRRIAAYLINSAIAFLPALFIFLSQIPPESAHAQSPEGALVGFIWALCYLFACGILQLIFMVAYRQTIGKKMLGLHLVGRNTLQPISFARYFGRELAECGLALFTGLITVVNFILLFAHKERQTTSDMIAATLVVVKKK